MNVNHEQAGQKAANYLLDKGYRHMVFLMGDKETDRISVARRNGMLQMFEEEDLRFTTLYGDSTYESGLQLAEQALSMNEKPDTNLEASDEYISVLSEFFQWITLYLHQQNAE